MASPLQSAVVIGAGTTLASLALAGGTAAWPASATQPVWALMAGGAVVIGFLVGFAVLRLGLHARRDLRNLAGFVRQLVDPSNPPLCSALSGPAGLTARAVEQTVGQLQQRVTELTRSRRELELETRVSEAERRNLEAILNAISDGVMVTDAFNEVTLANGSAARALRFDLLPALRRPVDEVLDEPRLIKLIKDTRDAGRTMRRSVEHRIDDQKILQVTTTCVQPDRAERGSGGVVTVLRDVTKDKEIAEMKSEFVSKVSHELRTPLSSIKAYIEMLIDGEAHDETTRAEFYDIVQTETDRLQRMIDNILSISQIESGVTKVQRQHVAVPKVVRGCVEVLRPQAAAKKITLIEGAFPAGAAVFADRDMLHQATMNVLSNAIKYTLPGGSVRVAVELDDVEHAVSVSVTDTGVGIPAQDLPRLFQKFYRVPSNNRVAPGTGLGLNLVKHVVETVHGGRVMVKSTVGQGSTFTYVLPMTDRGVGEGATVEDCIRESRPAVDSGV